MEIFLRTPYNYDMNQASDDTGINCQCDSDGVPTPSLTKQSFVAECDINTIVARFGLTGQLPSNVRMPTYGDFENVPTYQEALNALLAAQAAFAEMPANVRSRFANDPGLFVDFCSDPANLEEARKLGLAVPAPATPITPDPTRVIVVADEKKAPAAGAGTIP